MAHAVWKLYVDGAAKGNPGPAGIGIYITKAEHPFWQGSFYIGASTNNQAEYCALIAGLYYLQKSYTSGESVAIFADSQLLVKQVQGEYKVKNTGLKPLYRRVIQCLDQFSLYTIAHISRERNKKADQLANDALKTYYALPSYVCQLCSVGE